MEYLAILNVLLLLSYLMSRSGVTWYLYPAQYIVGAVTVLTIVLLLNEGLLPNQELSGAKSELQGETVGVCSFYKRSGQPPL